MKACIVGFGAIGPIHAKALSSLKNAELYAVCDISKERADIAAETYKAKAYYDFDECIKDESIETLHICTPHYLHFEMITKALKAGKKVIVEKPVTMTKEELDKLFSEYDVKNVFPIMQNRKNDCIEKLKNIIKTDSTLGALKGVKGILTWNRDAKYYESEAWRGTKNFEGGGVLINQAVHTLDLMVYLAGSLDKVRAKASNYSLENVIEVEDTIDAFMKFKKGATGIFYATNAYSTNTPMQIEVHFENKYFKYTDGVLLADGEVICEDRGINAGKAYWGSGHLKALTDYYEKGSKFNLFDVKDTMDAMFAIYKSAEENGKEISL